MSWTDVFPVLTDESISDFESQGKLHPDGQPRPLFEVMAILNEKRSATHIVATSLFWKRDMTSEVQIANISRESMINATELGLAGRYPPWESYVLPVIEGGKFLSEAMPNVVLRVYLANDLQFLIEELTASGCEIHLMESSSIRHNPGAMWRFLALEDASALCPVTITDADRIKWIKSDIARTNAACAAGVGGWRVPYEFGGSDLEGYRPINASQFGSNRPYPIRRLMEAFIYHSEQEAISTRCILKGLRQAKIAGTVWPDYGFDEWFLLAGLYPRMAFEGLLTFFPWDKISLGQFFTLDIEYCTWANARSELINYPNTKAVFDGPQPWENWHNPIELLVKSQTAVIVRARKCNGADQLIFKGGRRYNPPSFLRYSGGIVSLLKWAFDTIVDPWWVDLNPDLEMSSRGGCLFLGRKFKECDVAFCGYHFVKLTSQMSEWARLNELDDQVWAEGKLLKVPKLEGPMTLWKTTFSRKFYEDLVSQVPFVIAEILLRAWMDQGKVEFAEATAKEMGWRVR